MLHDTLLVMNTPNLTEPVIFMSLEYSLFPLDFTVENFSLHTGIPVCCIKPKYSQLFISQILISESTLLYLRL